MSQFITAEPLVKQAETFILCVCCLKPVVSTKMIPFLASSGQYERINIKSIQYWGGKKRIQIELNYFLTTLHMNNNILK